VPSKARISSHQAKARAITDAILDAKKVVTPKDKARVRLKARTRTTDALLPDVKRVNPRAKKKVRASPTPEDLLPDVRKVNLRAKKRMKEKVRRPASEDHPDAMRLRRKKLVMKRGDLLPRNSHNKTTKPTSI